MPNEELTARQITDELSAEYAARAREIEKREEQRRARRDARYPLPPGIYLIAAVAVVAAIVLTGMPAYIDVLFGLLVVLLLVSFYKSGERFMERAAHKNSGLKSDDWK